MRIRYVPLIAFFWTTTAVYAQTGNLGIGTSNPSTRLDVVGAIATREVNLTISNNVVTIPANSSQAVLSGRATATVSIAVPAAPHSGQRLTIYNRTSGGYNAVLNGYIIYAEKALEFVASEGGYRPVNNGSDASPAQWHVAGNPLSSADNFIGTIDSTAFVIRTAGRERMRVTAKGDIGVNTAVPGARLDVNGSLTAAGRVISTGSIYSRDLMYAGNIIVDAAGLGNGTASDGTVRFAGNTAIGSQRYSNLGFYKSLIVHTPAGPAMAIDSGGYVYVGNLTGITQYAPGLNQTSYRLSTMDGSIYCSEDLVATNGLLADNIITSRPITQQFYGHYANLPVGTNNYSYTWTHNDLSYPTLLCSLERVSGVTEIAVCYKHRGPHATEFIVAKGDLARGVSATIQWIVID